MQPFVVGRHPEQRLLAGLVERVASGEAQVVGIEGPPGIGKTTLLEDVVADLGDWTVLRCHQDPSRSKTMLAAVSELFEPLGWTYDASAVEPSATARALRERLEDHGHPVCLAVEDAQWLDQPSRDVLLQLARQVRDLPVLLLVTTRPLSGDDDFVRMSREPDRGRWIQLGPLQREGIRDLLVHHLGVEPDAGTLERILDVTGGYPIHLTELVHRLGASDDPTHTLTTTLAELRGAPVDRLLSQRVGTRLEEASPQARAALLAICLAEQLTWEQVCTVVEHRGLEAPTRSEVLDEGLVVASLRDTLRPRHAMLARAVIDDARADDVRDTHVALGEALSGTPSLRHRVRAARTPEDDPGLVAELEHRSLEHLLLGDAELSFALAFEAAALDPQRVGAAAITAMRVRRVDLVVSLEHLIGTETRRSRVKALRALVAAARQESDEARRQIRHVVPAECDDETLTILAYASHETCRRSVAQGDYSAGTVALRIRDELERRRQTALEAGTPPEFLGEQSVLIGLLTMWGLMTDLAPRDGRVLTARMRHLETDLEAWPRTEPVMAVVRSVRCSFMFFAGHYEEAMRDLAPIVDPPVLDADFLLQITQTRFQILFQSGQWDRAQVVARHALGRTMERLNDPGRHRLVAAGSAITRGRGESDPAVAQHAEHAPRLPAGQALVGAARAVADAWVWVVSGGDAARVADRLDQSWTDGPGGVYAGGLPTAVLRVRAHLAAGAIDLARQAADEVMVGWYDEAARAYVHAHCEALLAADTDPERASDLYGEASAAMGRHLAEQPECGLHLFRALLAEDWGDLLVARGRQVPAGLTTDLTAAIATVGSAGAREWRARLARLECRLAEIDDVGRAPHHLHVVPESDLLDVLTSREREISWLVADGLSNREIAGVLFLSVRTVEHHVAGALRKLDCPSRIELRQVLRARPGRVS